MNCISSANYENWANLQAVSKLHDTSYTDAYNLVGFYGYCGLKKKKSSNSSRFRDLTLLNSSLKTP